MITMRSLAGGCQFASAFASALVSATRVVSLPMSRFVARASIVRCTSEEREVNIPWGCRIKRFRRRRASSAVDIGMASREKLTCTTSASLVDRARKAASLAEWVMTNEFFVTFRTIRVLRIARASGSSPLRTPATTVTGTPAFVASSACRHAVSKGPPYFPLLLARATTRRTRGLILSMVFLLAETMQLMRD